VIRAAKDQRELSFLVQRGADRECGCFLVNAASELLPATFIPYPLPGESTPLSQ